MEFVGIDGCRVGWFYVGVDRNGAYSVGIIPKIEGISDWIRNADLILIDIPIGLLTKGTSERLCDREARQMIKPRGSTVFPAPSRSAIAKDSYEAGSAENLRCLGRKLSKQTWAIAGKIKEVDDFLTSCQSGRKVREMHPEVAFCGLNGGAPLLTRKKDLQGFNERLSLLKRFYPGADKVVDSARRKYSRNQLQDDDILDALVGAVTASHYPDLSTLPDRPPLDDKGLPMEMVYVDFNEFSTGSRGSTD